MGIRGNKKGISIIAAVFIIVILAFMGVMFLTLFTTSSSTSVNDLQSAQALYLAEAGAEYVLGNNTFPNYNVATTPVGTTGSFSVAPPTYLTGAVAVGNTTITVNSTSGFASPSGRIVIDSEVIAYTNIAGNTFNPAGPATVAHTNGNAVYPVTRVAGAALLGNCTATAIQVDYTNNFLIPGIITIGNEYFYCTGTATGPVRFTGCTRCYKGSSSAAHAIGDNVFQYIVTSTGTAGNSLRVVRESVGLNGNGGNAIVNGGFTANLNGWTETITSAQGASAWSNYPTTGGTPGSFYASNTAGTGNSFQGYRQEAIAIPSGASVTLNMQYCKYAFGATNGTSAMNTSVVIVYQGGGTLLAWNDINQPANPNCSNAANWNTPVNFTFPATADIVGVRIVYNLTNKSGSCVGCQKQVWFDEISLTTQGGVRPLSWQDVVN